MINKSDLILALKRCIDENCDMCPYDGICSTRDHALDNDIIEYLTEQEEPLIHYCGSCKSCNAPLVAVRNIQPRFCWMCGKMVKWNV